MVSAASDTMQDIASQADSLHARVVQIQTENEAALAKQRAIYEHLLKKQERNNHVINSTNAEIRKDIVGLKAGNADLKARGAELAKANQHFVSEIETLQSKVGISKDFLAASLPVEAEAKVAKPVVAHKTTVATLQHEEKSD